MAASVRRLVYVGLGRYVDMNLCESVYVDVAPGCNNAEGPYSVYLRFPHRTYVFSTCDSEELAEEAMIKLVSSSKRPSKIVPFPRSFD